MRTLGIKFDANTINAALTERDDETGRISIIDACTRKVPLTPNERQSIMLAKENTEVTARHAMRSARKNRRRYMLRRGMLLQTLKNNGLITDQTPMNDTALKDQWHTWRMRAAAPNEMIPLEDLARVIMMMNKHRGYKETKGRKDAKEGSIIDGAETLKEMTRLGMTPGQYVMHLRAQGDESTPKFYPSDLKRELLLIIKEQMKHHPEELGEDMAALLLAASTRQAREALTHYAGDEKKKKKELAAELEKARAEAVSGPVAMETLSELVPALIRKIEEGSALLGQMSDRSKSLIEEEMTPGQWYWKKMQEEGYSFSTRSLPFFRCDYKDEFDVIWETQSRFHPQLTDELREEIRDKLMYYQRDLKSKKGGYCPFESFKLAVNDPNTGETRLRTVGCRTAPKSSPLFQEYRMLCDVNNVTYRRNDDEKTVIAPTQQMKEKLASALREVKTMSDSSVLRAMGLDPKKHSLNFKEMNGNGTLAEIRGTLQKVAKTKGYKDFRKMLRETGACEGLADYDWNLSKEEYEAQPLVRLWILVDSYRYDDSKTGMDTLKRQIGERFGTDKETSEALAQMSFATGHGSLSHKAMKKLLPHLQEGTGYHDACVAEGYTVSEARSRNRLLDALPTVGKGQLMNPGAEKIINQLIHVINGMLEYHGNPDRVVIELPRELNTCAKVKKARAEVMAKRTRENVRYAEEVKKITGRPKATAMQILKYRLYEELKENGYRTLYSDRPIDLKTLLDSEVIHREHIIPQSVIFDDNFVNYTLEYADVDEDKKDMPARDYVLSRYGQEGLERYQARVENLYRKKAISKAKYNYLLMTRGDVPNNILDRQTPTRQYAMKELAKMLALITPHVLYTVPDVTRKLTDDWGLRDVINEVNAEEYARAGRVTRETTSDGKQYDAITVREYVGEKWTEKPWNPSMDPRGRLVDAMVISMTTPSHIMYLNNLAGAKENDSKMWNLRKKITTFVNGKRVFRTPVDPSELRNMVSETVRTTLVSVKPESRVTNRKRNVTKAGNGESNIQLTMVPRGALHKDTVLSQVQVPEDYTIKINPRSKIEDIRNVKDAGYRKALLERLKEHGDEPATAFGGKNNISKNPVWIDEKKTNAVPAEVTCSRTVTRYTVRTEINDKINVKKIVSEPIRKELERRIEERGSLKKAVEDLKSNPITVNGQVARRVKIISTENKVFPLRYKRNADGQTILDSDGRPIPCDFVRPGDNHHFEIFRDKKGQVQINVISFFESVRRKTEGQPVYDSGFKKDEGWQYRFHLSKGEAVLFPDIEEGFVPEMLSVEELNASPEVSRNLYYVQKFTEGEYVFRHHSDNNVADDPELYDVKLKKIRGSKGLSGVVKVRINHLGKIVEKLGTV